MGGAVGAAVLAHWARGARVELVGECADWYERVRFKAIKYLLGVAARFDDPGVAQHAELLAEQRLADAGGAFDLADGEFGVADRENQLQADRVGEHAEQIDEVIVDDRYLGRDGRQSGSSGVSR